MKKKEDNFGKKRKKYVGKVKAKFSTSSILKIFFDKDNFEKNNMWGNTIVWQESFGEIL
jgi:hypothetical protein